MVSLKGPTCSNALSHSSAYRVVPDLDECECLGIHLCLQAEIGSPIVLRKRSFLETYAMNPLEWTIPSLPSPRTSYPRSQNLPKPPSVVFALPRLILRASSTHIRHRQHRLRRRTGPRLANVRSYHIESVCDPRYNNTSTSISLKISLA